MRRFFVTLLGGLGLVAALIATSGAAAGRDNPGFDGAVTWLNSAPLTPGGLRGKAVLVDFWTYSCINCIRTLPYVRAWADKYRDEGLTVVGVHTPEFRFEQDLTNVTAALERFRIDFPVAVDSNGRIWDTWGNNAWPAYYLVDATGKVRYRQLGEGGYDKLERQIQALLAEARGKPLAADLVRPATMAEQAAPDLNRLQSGETYIGYRQASGMRSPERVRRDEPQQYSLGALALNQWGLRGPWTVGAEAAVAQGPGSAIAHRFSARDLHLVMGAGAAGRKVRIQVTLDGHAPGADHGADIDVEGNGIVGGTRLYQLIRQSGRVGERRFEIRFLDQGAEAYAFTFG